MSAPSPTQTQAVPVSFTREGTILLPAESGDQQEADAVFSTGEDVVRQDFLTGERFIERLRIDENSIRLERLQSGNSNLLDGHNSFGGVAAILGSVLSASVRNGQLVGTLKILHADTWRLLKGGAARALSIGYRVFRYEIQAATAEALEVREAVDFEPMEISVVPINADAGAAVTATRSLEPTPVGGNKIMDQIVTLEQATAAARGAKMADPDVMARSWINAKLTAVQAQNLALDHVAREIGDDGTRPNVIPVGEDMERLGRRQAMTDGLLLRMDSKRFPSEDGRVHEYASKTVLEIARECLGRSSRGMDRMKVLREALRTRGGQHGTGDFPGILEDALGKSSRRRYEELVPSFAPITRTTFARDFKNINKLQLGDAPELKKVEEHGEFTRGTISESKESYKLAVYGRVFEITRQALINDDLDAFAKLPEMFGRASRHLESNLVWQQFTENGEMADGNAVFSTAHSNLASTGTAISVGSLSKGHAAMRAQKGQDYSHLNIKPTYLVVPTALEIQALKVVETIVPEQVSNSNPFSGMLSVIAEPRLDDDSLTRWYLCGHLDQIDIVEMAMLEGSSGPMIESRVGFDSDGLEIKACHDCAAKILDWRGLYANPGT